MANFIQRIEKYSKDALDTVLALESKTNVLVNGDKFIDLDFKEAGYVKVMSILMDGLSDYYRVNNGLGSANNGYSTYPSNDGYKIGNVEATWELFKLDYDRGKQFRVDNMDNEETAGKTIGALLTEFLRTRVVPEIDAVRFSKMVAKTSTTLGNRVVENISDNAIIGKFNTAYKWLAEHEVPAEDQVIFVSNEVMLQIRNTTELYKRLSQAEYKGDVTFTIETYEGRPIIEVPDNRFFSNVVTGANGYYAGDGSKLINFIVCSKKCVVPVVKLEKSKIWTPEQVQDFDGYKVNFRLYHDVLVPKNKIAGVYASLSSSVNGGTKSNVLSVNIVKTDDGFKMTEYFANPAGLMGKMVVRSASAFSVGTAYSTSATVVETKLDTEFTKFASETAQYYALLDANGLCIATSGSVTLPTE